VRAKIAQCATHAEVIALTGRRRARRFLRQIERL
jgi:hypothetical protein